MIVIAAEHDHIKFTKAQKAGDTPNAGPTHGVIGSR